MPDGDDLTVREFASTWLEDVRARAHPKTYIRYESEYRFNVDPFLGTRKLVDVSRRDVKQLVAHHVRRGLNPSMLLRVLSNLFFSAFEEGRISSQPAQRLWKFVRQDETTVDVRAFTKEQLAVFLHVSLSEPVYSELFRTMAFSGLRSGEARALVASDVHEKAKKLDVMRTFSGDSLSGSTKTRAARRIEIPRELAEMLGRRARDRKPDGWLFDRRGDFLRNRAVSQAFRRILKRAELPRRYGTHSLRHTYASHLIAQGVPIVYVQRQLGHRSIKQTVDVYGRWIPLSQTGELERLVLETKASSPKSEAEEENGLGRLLKFPFWTPALMSRTSCSRSSESDFPDSDPDSEGDGA